MKKALTLIIILLLIAGTTVYAGGDKNRGSKGQGKVNQVVGP